MGELVLTPERGVAARSAQDPLADFTLRDVEQVRLLLRGGSVID